MNKHTGDDIRALFKEGVDDLSLDETQKQKLVTIKDEAKSLTPLQRFLEKEICIPVSSLAAATGMVVVAMALLLNTLLLPGEVPEPKYQIIEMHNSYSYDYHQGDSGGGQW